MKREILKTETSLVMCSSVGSSKSRVFRNFARNLKLIVLLIMTLNGISAFGRDYDYPWISERIPREKSITVSFLGNYYHTLKSERWETDQIWFYTRDTEQYTYNNPIVDPNAPLDANKVAYYSRCSGAIAKYNSYDVVLQTEVTEAGASGVDATNTIGSIKWYNIPKSLNGKWLSQNIDNDAGCDESCGNSWNNSFMVGSLYISDYFRISPSVDYTASTVNVNRVKINFTIDQGETSVTHNIKLLDGLNLVKEINQTANSGAFDVDIADPTQRKTYTIKVVTILTLASGKKITHEYESLVPVDSSTKPSIISLTSDACTNSVRVALGQRESQIVERCENSSFSGGNLVSTLVPNSVSVFVDPDGLSHNKTYYYRVRLWGKVYSNPTTILTDFTPTKPLITLIDTTLKARIRIRYSSLCGNVAKLIIKRRESGVGGDVVLEDSYSKDSIFYTDYSAKSCKKYAYKVVAVSNMGVEGESVWSAYKYYSYDIGNSISNLKVSKGYFPQKTVISWSCNGALDNFIIDRKEYGTNNTVELRNIPAIGTTGAVGVRNYTEEDATGAAGVVYEYTVRGLLSCADNMAQTNNKSDIGFRTPTGDIYGRVTFESGQAVKDVEVRLESDNGVVGKSLGFTSGQYATISNSALLSTNKDSLTVQLWVKPTTTTANQVIFSKQGMYELGIENDHFWFMAGSNKVVSTDAISVLQRSGSFIHLTGVYTGTSLLIYVNGRPSGSITTTSILTGNTNKVNLGVSFTGIVDELRLWSSILNPATIKRNYSSCLTGGEKGLIGYWNFNFATDTDFYDLSYLGTNYNENHGKLNGALLSSDIPTNDQLGYKGFTETDGSYAIRGVPYVGNGTAYKIIPLLGIHQFESQREVRFIGEGAQSHTVNFTDKSSFLVSGRITYRGGTIPVGGVSFKIDGIPASRNGEIVTSDATTGEFTISVPVGVHEVKAEKFSHVFEKGGRITDNNGQNLNYQDQKSSIELIDSTTVKFIGRISGGSVQEAYPLGHSLSKNNLADGIKLNLTWGGNGAISGSAKNPLTTKTRIPHFLAKYITNSRPDSSTVEMDEKTITIYPSEKTGEFVAYVIPETFTITVDVPHYDDKPSEQLNFSNSFTKQMSVYSHKDSVLSNGHYTYKNYSDSVSYQVKYNYNLRSMPTMSVAQLDSRYAEMTFFGTDTVTNIGVDGKKTKFAIATKPAVYALSSPVFQQQGVYRFKINAFEEYKRYASENTVKVDASGYQIVDRVPTNEAVILFTNPLALKTLDTLKTSAIGEALYTFTGGIPDISNPKKIISASLTVGTQPTIYPFSLSAIGLGAIPQGSNFITAGPDKVLMVLRDPPGSNSYSYLEKGVTCKTTSTYTGSISNEGFEKLGTKIGLKTITLAGFGVITGGSTDMEESAGIKLLHEESYQGEDTKETTTTTTTRFQTSDDPNYVGPDGDVYIGTSTNIIYGMTNSIIVIPKEKYDAAKYKLFTAISDTTDNFLLVQTNSLGIGQVFATDFAYPQRHIESTLIPQMIELRNNILSKDRELKDLTDLQLQQLSDTANRNIVISLLDSNNPDYGKSNNDPAFSSKTDPYPNDDTKGYSYKIFMPKIATTADSIISVFESLGFKCDIAKNTTDSIMYLNESVNNWKNQMMYNEQAKVAVSSKDLVKNYSFQGGASVEYSETYATAKTHTSTFSIMLGLEFAKTIKTEVMGSGLIFEMEENVKTTHGGTFATNTEATHQKGFVLSDNGQSEYDSGTDYESVDVFHEPGWNSEKEEYESGYISKGYNSEISSKDSYSTFIFKTRGGATSCPYEKEYKTKYFEPGKYVINEATIQLEIPGVTIAPQALINVPSGNAARFEVSMYNKSPLQFLTPLWLEILDDEASSKGAKFFVDGAPLGEGRAINILPNTTVVKTLEVYRGSEMNYDNIKLILSSQCDLTVGDTILFSVHYTPSCSEVNIKKPANNWVYNTNLDSVLHLGVLQHYMNVELDGFNVNYDNFHHIELQRKTKAQSDKEWVSIMNFYNTDSLYSKAIADGKNASRIESSDMGTIKYRMFMDSYNDQHYDLRAVSACEINHELVYNQSEIHSGLKDMYRPRLFGNELPANGILTVEDDIRLNFNEMIAGGLLTKDNFQVTGVRNGSKTDHSVSVQLDGDNDFMATEFEKNLTNKSFTVEMWINANAPQNATLFSQGNINESVELSLTADNYLKVKMGSETVLSKDAVPFEAGTWAHVALVYDTTGYASAYYNFKEVISHAKTGFYSGIGNVNIGKSIATNSNFYKGKIHNVRLWNSTVTSGELQLNSLAQLSGIEQSLMACYPMNEGKGTTLQDIARGATLIMNGCKWAMPDGFAVATNGLSNYLKLDASSAAITKEMDYTIEFWFNAAPAQINATLVSLGRGDGSDVRGSANCLSVGFDEVGALSVFTNSKKFALTGEYRDNNWHHFAISVSRAKNKGQIYVDGNMTKYFEASTIGGLAAKEIFLGARGSYLVADPQNAFVDNYFKGKLDDFRFWELYKDERLVKEKSNEKLLGNEFGLLHYYPFDEYVDHQGLRYLQFSNKDKHVANGPTPDTDVAVLTGGSESEMRTNEIAPLKDAGAVANLDFDFVVNNDALIINLNEPEDKVAKTIVTFSTYDVRDVNNNAIASPITWSAYIDRNQLKWSDTEINFSKPVYKAGEFKVNVVNSGGSVQHFSIDNLPSFLEVTTRSGNLNPSSSQQITFTVNEALNVGVYNEVIYLTNSQNVSEALPINITVMGEKPNWTVNPADYKYNMSVLGKLRINNLYSADKADLLAAFTGGKCVGVTTSTYNKNLDMWYALLTVYSDTLQPGNVEFRMWDASTGKVYLATPDRAVPFINNSVVGNVANPVIFDGKEFFFQDIQLAKGWNWISFNLANSMMSNVNTMLSKGQWDAKAVVKSRDCFDSYNTTKKRWEGSLSNSGKGFNNTSMYMVKSSVDQVLSVSGTVVNSKLNPIWVRGNQWNYIGYLPFVNSTVKEALADYKANDGDVIKSRQGFAMHYMNEWVGSLNFLEANKGYMLLRNSADSVSFIYPTLSGSLGNGLKSASVIENGALVNSKYGNNMSIVATSTGMKSGDQVKAYINNELRGTASCFDYNNKVYSFMNVTGEELDGAIRFELVQNNSQVQASSTALKYSSNAVVGNVKQPLELDFGTSTINEVLVYPIPAKDVVTVEFNANSGDKVTFEVVDIAAQSVLTLKSAISHSGNQQQSLNVSTLKSGIYLLKVTVNNVTTNSKIEKK